MPAADAHLLFPGDGELAALMRSKDWSTTSLGPPETWPAGLRAAVRIVLTSRFSMWMGWGDELAFLYNDAYRRDTLGAKHPRSLGMPTRELWSEVWPEIAPRIATVLEGGASTWDEGLLLILERSGYREETYHTFSYSPLHDDEGRVRGVLSVVTEETARLISERRVALLGKLGSEIAGTNTNEGVLAGLARSLQTDARDLPFTLTYLIDDAGTTARLASQTGFPTDHPAASPTLDLETETRWGLREALETGRPVEVSLGDEGWPAGPWATSPNTAFVVPFSLQGQARPSGVFIAGLNPHRVFDAAYREFVTLFEGQLAAGLANARAYDQERHRAESLAELDRAKTAFFSNVSHEFRTPLTLMLGPLGGLLEDPEVTGALHDELVTIERNGLRLLKLVNTMLDFSRIEAGRATAQFEPVDLAQLTTDLASVFRAATEKAGLRLTIACEPLATPVSVDRDMWEKIVLNLMSNAFKFTFEGEIAVALRRVDDTAILTVRDTGGGIPAAELPRVFERFHRVDGARGRTHEGTGIGLALVQELVRLHQGTIEVASELGRGTTFTVTIPIRTTATAIEPHAASNTRARTSHAFATEAMRWLPDAPAAEPAERASVARERLLVVDDNADMRAYMTRLLGVRWEVEAVANGREALDAIARRRPDLVITDVMMPELDGFGLLAALREDVELREIPVIMLSARAGEEARVEGLQAGASDYLVKPFAARELRARVETQLMRAAVRSAAAEQARRINDIFRQAPVAIATLRGPDHVFEIANEPYTMKVINGRDVIGQRVVDAIPEAGPQGFIELLDRVYATGEPYIGRSLPFQLSRPDGTVETQFLDFIYQPMVDTTGQVTGIAAIIHDVTELSRARKEAEAANRAKDEFLAMLGHELRNPLAPIMTALELMNLRANGVAQRERAVIERQVKHLTGLVDDLLDVSRITRGKVELRKVPVDLASVVARSIEVVSPLLDEHRHTLEVSVPGDLRVHGDIARLAQVVSNLLTNAAKYTPSSGRIAIRARRDGEQIVLAVRDNGIGIDAEMLPEVFQPFAQARQSIDRSRGGLGLGLAIVANLVMLHGGSVTARSEGRGHGSEFEVRLPAFDGPTAAATSSPVAPTVDHGAGRILVVDDNVDAALMLSELLEAAGYQTCAAHDGPGALDSATLFRPQVAVLDLGLPVMDGFELARLLKSRPDLAGTHLVAVTGYGQTEDRTKTKAAGFSAHLVKPVDMAKLREVIEQLLPKRSNTMD